MPVPKRRRKKAQRSRVESGASRWRLVAEVPFLLSRSSYLTESLLFRTPRTDSRFCAGKNNGRHFSITRLHGRTRPNSDEATSQSRSFGVVRQRSLHPVREKGERHGDHQGTRKTTQDGTRPG